MPLAAPANAAPFIVLAWMVIGLLLFAYFRARDPKRIGETSSVFLEEAPA